MGLRLLLLSAMTAVIAAAPATAVAAPSPALAGAWEWKDHDEVLANARNPTRALIIVRGRVTAIRFGRGPAARMRLSRNGRSFTFVTRRFAGRSARKSTRVRVRYGGRVVRTASGPRLSGRLVLLHRRYPGASVFSAAPRR